MKMESTKLAFLLFILLAQSGDGDPEQYGGTEECCSVVRHLDGNTLGQTISSLYCISDVIH